MLEVVDPGTFACVQDRGRTGYVLVGVARSGAFDLAAHDLANRLVGNSPAAATIEFTFGGLALRMHDAATVALTGAPVPGLDHLSPVTLPAGAVVRFGSPHAGVRSYLAVRGGVDVEPVLHSRSRDSLGDIGPPPLQAGDLLPVGTGVITAPATGDVSTGWQPPSARLPVVLGPRADWFTADAVRTLIAGAWQVRPDSDRIGVRLDGPRLLRVRPEELPSEPTLPGAIQVPPDGRPIVLGPDAPVTGGYPVIAVLRRRYLDHVAQLRPGDFIHFRE
jgi:biotin-dependent carboxylase-like uncharacterized protein